MLYSGCAPFDPYQCIAMTSIYANTKRHSKKKPMELQSHFLHA